jgi:phosphoribosyl-AMP cyclohydrolase / phosphoribosyl-ATP pyrophosphohydrolase
MRKTDIIDFSKGIVPAIVQDNKSGRVLMQGYINEEAWQKTLSTKLVTFFSRSKNRLWTKGEESGHTLDLVDWGIDCDGDAILIKANPNGPTCHTGSDTCWEEDYDGLAFIARLEAVIKNRKDNPDEKSYTSKLFARGINKIAQKVGEEAVEIVIEAKDDNKDLFLGEAADLLFHYMILLQAKGYSLDDVIGVLKERHKVG